MVPHKNATRQCIEAALLLTTHPATLRQLQVVQLEHQCCHAQSDTVDTAIAGPGHDQ